MYDFSKKYSELLDVFETYLSRYAEQVLQSRPNVLGEAMKYSLLSGGKRVRPVLMLAVAEMLNVAFENVLPYALAIEMIHTYSLIHDDLPAMDDDDFRRGKPSCHKQFGESIAILAGDALLNQAFSIVIEAALKGEKYALAAKLLADFAGMNGMIAGQVADMVWSQSKTEVNAENLTYIQENKTGKLLLAPVLIPSILAENKFYIRLEQFGKELGKLFQVTDDILDVTGEFEALGKTVGKDEDEDKFTCVKLYGLKGALLRADDILIKCCAILEGIDANVEFLRDLAHYVRERNH